MLNVKINEKLKNDIIGRIPEEYTNLEKAMFIYRELCLKLQYSIEYFVNEDTVKQQYVDAKNLELVDGENNKDVVCFTFNAILAEMLHEAGVCNYVSYDYNADSQRFPSVHESINVRIDGQDYEIDGTYGILDNNDLTLSKFSTHKPQGWESSSSEGESLLNSAIEKVYSSELELDKNTQKYVQIKNEDNSYLTLPFEQRVGLFMKMAKDCPDYSVVSFNYLLKLKNMLFSKEEQGKSGVEKKFDLHFVKDNKTKTLKALIFVNPNGYVDDLGYENFESLSIVEYDVKNRTMSDLDLETTQKRVQQRDYISHRDNKTLQMFSMAKEGKLRIKEIPDGEPIYDHHQNLVNVARRERFLVKENRYIPYERGEE